MGILVFFWGGVGCEDCLIGQVFLRVEAILDVSFCWEGEVFHGKGRFLWSGRFFDGRVFFGCEFFWGGNFSWGVEDFLRGQIFGRWLFWELPKGKRESFLADVSFLRIEVLWARESFLELKCFYRKRGIFFGRWGIFGGGEVQFFRLTFFFLGTRVRGGTGKKGKEKVVSSMNRIYCINTECATC